MHVNNRENAEIIEKFLQRGFSHDESASRGFRETLPAPFFHTLMVFRKQSFNHLIVTLMNSNIQTTKLPFPLNLFDSASY